MAGKGLHRAGHACAWPGGVRVMPVVVSEGFDTAFAW